jgi:tetratricopeptide (TPR) repeat protein
VAARKEVFISATSADLGSYRRVVKDALLTLGAHPIEESNFPTDHRELSDLLERRLDPCDAVIHLVGFYYGGEPKQRPDLPRRSWTQWEYYRATEARHPKPVYRFLAREDCAFDTRPLEDSEKQRLQLEHREQLKISGGHIYYEFSTPEELKQQILSIDELRDPALQGASNASVPIPKIDISRLPATEYMVFGREAILTQLTNAWSSQRTRLVTIVATAGTGKTALVNQWIYELGKDNAWGGAEGVFAWSFFSQGASVSRQISSDLFVSELFRYLELPDPGPVSPWERGRLLGEAVSQKRILLILDGLEPLQTPPTSEDRMGRLADQTICAFLRGLAATNKGLCIVTTRLRVADLLNVPSDNHLKIDLEHLDEAAGAELLRSLLAPTDADLSQKELVRNTPETELRRASAEFDGHALALRLLGNCLAYPPYNGDIRRRTAIGPLLEASEEGAQARRVLSKYEEWFAGKPELKILQLVGLFDRPAEEDVVVKLRKPPPIPHLTDQFPYPNNSKWNKGLGVLRRLALITTKRSKDLDCHPLVREYFGARFRTVSAAAWTAAHSRLFEYFQETPRQWRPDTLAEMEPLYRAIAHGCQASRGQEAFELYVDRIRQGERAYSVKVLGALSSDLAALSWFFKTPWEEPIESLNLGAKMSVLNFAGFRLFGLGRIREAIEPALRAFDLAGTVKTHNNASPTAILLSEMFFALGDLDRAMEFGKKAVALADSREASAVGFNQQRTRQIGCADDLWRRADTTGQAAGSNVKL